MTANPPASVSEVVPLVPTEELQQRTRRANLLASVGFGALCGSCLWVAASLGDELAGPAHVPPWMAALGVLLLLLAGALWAMELPLRRILEKDPDGRLLLQSGHGVDVRCGESGRYVAPQACCLCRGEPDPNPQNTWRCGCAVSEMRGQTQFQRTLTMKFPICRRCLALAQAARPLRISARWGMVTGGLLIVSGPFVAASIPMWAALLSVLSPLAVVFILGLAIDNHGSWHPVDMFMPGRLYFQSVEYAELALGKNPGWTRMPSRPKK